MNYLLDEIQRGASGGDAPVAWRGGGLPARWFVDPVVLPHCRRENTLRRFAPSPASGRCAVSRYRTLGVWLTAEISIFFKPSYGGYTSESVSGTAGLPTTVLT